MLVSVIIPTFNEEKVISECLLSLSEESIKEFEVIVIDDGSTDRTLTILSELKIANFKFKVLQQDHLGAGKARNLGVSQAMGDILVFVDADMTFDKKFLANLIKPIVAKKAIGTFSKDELVLNKTNVWSKCWNINKGLPINRMHSKDYPDEQEVFRAILKKDFLRVGGFDSIGYIDDYTLYMKLKVKAKVATHAFFYHRNPENLREVFNQARWIGKNEYKNRKIKNEFLMKIISLFRYGILFSLLKGLFNAMKFKLPQYLLFKVIYDLAIEISLVKSFFGEQLYK